MEGDSPVPLALVARGGRDYVHSADVIDGLLNSGLVSTSTDGTVDLTLVQPIRTQAVVVRASVSNAEGGALLARATLGGSTRLVDHLEIRAAGGDHRLRRVEDGDEVRAVVSGGDVAVLDPAGSAHMPYLHTAAEMVKAVHRCAFPAVADFWVARASTETDWLGLPPQAVTAGLSVRLETPMRRGMTRSSVWLGDRRVAVLHFRMR